MRLINRKFSLPLLSLVFALITLAGVVYFWSQQGSSRDGTTNIEQAQLESLSNKRIENQGSELGLGCTFEIVRCVDLIGRAEKNPRLKKAFLEAKERGVLIMPRGWPEMLFSVGEVRSGYVNINVNKSDKSIVAFLTN